MPKTTRRNRSAEADFRGEKPSNAPHMTVTDPNARLYKKSPGKGAMPCFMGHTLMESRNGLVVQAALDTIDRRTTRHPGYQVSQQCSKKIEEPFGSAKTVGGMTQTFHRGIKKVRVRFTMTMAACNLARLARLLAR